MTLFSPCMRVAHPVQWVTSMIDTDSSNFEYALNNSFFVTNAFESFSTLKWWHGEAVTTGCGAPFNACLGITRDFCTGEGGLLDYTNPAAVAWWHSQMDNVLSLGIVSCSI